MRIVFWVYAYILTFGGVAAYCFDKPEIEYITWSILGCVAQIVLSETRP